MLLSISNIAWAAENDAEMYAFLRDKKFCGLEIAPTRIFPDTPYIHINEAKMFSAELKEKYGLSISSMQSIWYGRGENIFGSKDERRKLIEYTKQAIDFAAAIGCGNLVFGCPKNRNRPDDIKNYEGIAYDFFSQIAEYSAKNATIIALEPNPPMYGTNFINTTEDAIYFCRQLNHEGLKVNIDVGTMIANGEPVSLVADNLDIVNHIHISEPKLAPIEKRELHREISALKFNKYVSIEMGNCGDLVKVKKAAEYVAGSLI